MYRECMIVVTECHKRRNNILLLATSLLKNPQMSRYGLISFLFFRLQEYALSMSAKPATIYLGTRSHNCRRPGHPKRHQEGRYRNLIKGRSSFKKQAAGQGTEAAIQRYHNHQLSVKKVVKFTNQVGKR